MLQLLGSERQGDALDSSASCLPVARGHVPCPGRTNTLEAMLFLSRSRLSWEGTAAPFATPGSPQDLNKMRYEIILIYSAGVSSFQLRMLLSLPMLEHSEAQPQPRALPLCWGGQGQEERQRDGQMDTATFSLLVYFLFTVFFLFAGGKRQILFL